MFYVPSRPRTGVLEAEARQILVVISRVIPLIDCERIGAEVVRFITINCWVAFNRCNTASIFRYGY